MRTFPRVVLCAYGAVVLGGGSAAAQSSPWVVQGVVRDSAGKPIPNVTTHDEATKQGAVSDSAGRFRLTTRGDSIRLLARHIGRQVYRKTIARPFGDSVVEVNIRLAAVPVQLVPVNVGGAAEVYDARLSGFYARSQGKSGHFIGRERLGRLTSHRFTDLLREVPGVRFGMVGRGGSQERTIRLRGANCAPTVFFDGLPASAGEYELDAIDLGTVEGVEIYNGLATIPAVFLAPRGTERCGVIAIWSRPSRPK